MIKQNKGKLLQSRWNYWSKIFRVNNFLFGVNASKLSKLFHIDKLTD